MTGAKRPHGLIYALLALSLAVNLIGVGYFGYTGFGQRPPKTVERTIDFVTGRYPAKAAYAIREKLEARRGDLQSALDELKAARREARRQMRQKPFERIRVEAAFETVRRKGEAFQMVVQGAIVDGVAGLPQNDRDEVGGDDPD